MCVLGVVSQVDCGIGRFKYMNRWQDLDLRALNKSVVFGYSWLLTPFLIYSTDTSVYCSFVFVGSGDVKTDCRPQDAACSPVSVPVCVSGLDICVVPSVHPLSL